MVFSAQFDLGFINGLNGFVQKGTLTEARFGYSVSSAGDLNGDGFDDIIIGTGQNRQYSTVDTYSYVIFGRPAAIRPYDDTINIRISGGGLFGSTVSGAGDVNGDGFDDLIIGSTADSPNGIYYAGVSYVVFGQSSGFAPRSLNLPNLDGSNGFVINGIDEFDYSGGSVSSAGDVNGDGFDDLIIGASRADPNGKGYAGETYVVFGRSSGFGSSLNLSSLDGRNGFVLNGIDEFDSSGGSVSSAGDVNGDGFDDIIIGAPRSGESYVVFGRSSGFGSSLDLTNLNGRNGFVLRGDSTVRSVSGAGDVNGDGFDDIIIGAPFRRRDYYSSVGESFVVFGRSSGFGPSLNLSSLDGRNGLVIKGSRGDYEGIGFSVSGAGDFNGDGFDDIIIGAPFAAERTYASRDGFTYVVYGQASRPPRTDRILGTSTDDLLVGDRFNNPIFGLAGDDTLRGGQGDDQLIGGGGNDLIVGGAGGDRLIGGNGFDTLRGGAGEDEFVFQNVRHKADRILDFNVTEDVILISKSGFDLDLGKGSLANARFTIGGSASDRSDRFIYNDQTGALIFDADGSGAESGRAIAFLRNSPNLTAANIRII